MSALFALGVLTTNACKSRHRGLPGSTLQSQPGSTMANGSESGPAADENFDSQAETAACSHDEVITIPVPIPAANARDIKYMTQTQILFTLSALTSAPLTPVPLDNQRPGAASAEGVVAIPCASIAPGAVAILRQASSLERYIDTLSFIKKVVFDEGHYGRQRNFQRPKFPIPAHRDQLMAQIFGKTAARTTGATLKAWDLELLKERGWQVSIKSPSRAKGRARAIFRYEDKTWRDGHPPMSIALTLEPRQLDVKDATTEEVKVLETELIIKREETANQSGHFDFYAYGENGHLEPCAVFFNGRNLVRGPSPHTCMGCHNDYERRLFTPDPFSFKGRPVENWHDPALSLEALESRLIDSCQ